MVRPGIGILALLATQGCSPWPGGMCGPFGAAPPAVVACSPIEGCEGVLCAPCMEALRITVVDSITGERIADSSSTDPSLTCGGGVCYGGRSAGDYSFSVSAPGYATRAVQLTVPAQPSMGCCSCGYQTLNVEVRLDPVDSCHPESCGACAPPLQVTFVNEGGGTITDAAVDDLAATCSHGSCAFSGVAGTYVFTVTATGYQPRDLSFEVGEAGAEACCSCGYVPRSEQVVLTAK